MSKVVITRSRDDVTGQTVEEDIPAYVVTIAPAIELKEGQDKPSSAQLKAQKEASETFPVDMLADTYDALVDLFKGDRDALYELIRPVSAGGKSRRVRNGAAKAVREWAAAQVANGEEFTKEWPELTTHGRIPDAILDAFKKHNSPAPEESEEDSDGEEGDKS